MPRSSQSSSKPFKNVLSGGEFILGKEVRALEEEFAAYVGTKYAVGVASGTDAIKIGGLALGLKPGDRFVTTPNTYIATAMALSEHGCIPRFCDIEDDSYNMDPAALEELLKKDPGIRLCVPVHLYGQPCRLDEIREIWRTARRHGDGGCLPGTRFALHGQERRHDERCSRLQFLSDKKISAAMVTAGSSSRTMTRHTAG